MGYGIVVKTCGPVVVAGTQHTKNREERTEQ